LCVGDHNPFIHVLVTLENSHQCAEKTLLDGALRSLGGAGIKLRRDRR
jgi:hypothetical protein